MLQKNLMSLQIMLIFPSAYDVKYSTQWLNHIFLKTYDSAVINNIKPILPSLVVYLNLTPLHYHAIQSLLTSPLKS